MSTFPEVMLLWIFRGKLEMERVAWPRASERMRQIVGCTRANVYRTDFDGKLYEYEDNYWRTALKVPDEIKLAAMLLN